jgi:hypothetical protein
MIQSEITELRDDRERDIALTCRVEGQYEQATKTRLRVDSQCDKATKTDSFGMTANYDKGDECG